MAVLSDALLSGEAAESGHERAARGHHMGGLAGGIFFSQLFYDPELHDLQQKCCTELVLLRLKHFNYLYFNYSLYVYL